MKGRKIMLALVVLALAGGCGGKGAADSEKQPDEKSGPHQKGTVQLDDESLKLVAIDTVAVGHGKMDLALHAPGHISFNLNHTAKVTPTFEARLAKMNCDIGTNVREGDVMAVLDSPELLNHALELKAPISGQVIQRLGTVGELVDKGKELYTISDPRSVWVIADVNAGDVAPVRVGQVAAIHITADPGQAVAGRVETVSPDVDEKLRTVEVRLSVDNENMRLKPGMFADVEIFIATLDNVVAIPDEAIQRLDEQEIVFVATDAHTFAKRVIKTGRTQDGKVEILDGLKDGERVVTKGSFVLKSELLKSEFGE